ncbi:MAG: pyruvate dehydrogenase complex dihydrolipoamide acetyltransferase [Wolbachia endosymbiont of Menacanthus eurysternus]|nr:MAG: pyruvate dehydrogenase complex dihydrolipoamide acetyltransferase [Wolbachia endosymbiont of Menacanthus eurysternus]
MPIEILMPSLSPTMSKIGGKIVRWCKKEQDRVEIGDVIAEIETDKTVMEFESINEGVLAKILVPEGINNIPVNQPIALILEDGEDSSTLNQDYITDIKTNKKTEKYTSASSDFLPPLSSKTMLIPPQYITSTSGKEKNNIKTIERIKISPLARKMAKNKNLDIKQLKGTGPYGRIIKADVLKFLNKNIQTKSREKLRENVIIKINNMRRTIAQRLVEAKQNMPHFYLTIDCQVDKLISLKNEINSIDKNNKVTINDLIIKAVAFGIKKNPDVNSSWIGDKILKYTDIDISIAVALKDGLITPIIKNADKKNILSISKEVKDLISRAKSGKLKPEEFQGGGFTISNLGMFGIKTFSAIINPPQSCIMAIGAAEKQPVIINNKIEIAEIIIVTLSIDHRLIDGTLGAKFLNEFKHYIENPLTMLLEAT